MTNGNLYCRFNYIFQFIYFRHLHLNCSWDHLILWVLTSNEIASPRRVSAELPKSASSNAILDPIKVPVSFRNYFWTFPRLAPDEVSEMFTPLSSGTRERISLCLDTVCVDKSEGLHYNQLQRQIPPPPTASWSITDVNYNWIHKRTHTHVGLLSGLVV